MKPASARMKRDPTAAEPLIRRYEKRILSLFEDYKTEVQKIMERQSILLPLKEKGAAKSPFPLTPPSPPKIKTLIDTKAVQQHLDQAGVFKVNIPGELIINEETERAYKQGMKYGNGQLKSVGSGIALGQGPKDARMLQALKDRSLADLKGITDATSTKIMRTITDGIINDEEFGKITREIVRQVDNVGITRATMMVRTETMKAVNTGVISRYEAAGAEEVEFLAALDDRTCDECDSLNGKTFPIGEAPDVPVHPNCRCTFIPVVKIPTTESLREPAPGLHLKESLTELVDKDGHPRYENLWDVELDQQTLEDGHIPVWNKERGVWTNKPPSTVVIGTPVSIPGTGQGEQGPPGPQGEQGIPGDKGESGERGADGAPGIKGDRGDIGAQGEPGEQGEKGADGLPGERGEKGDQGVQGVPGQAGEKGEKGDKGDVGDPGIQGEQGIPGQQGDPGIQGAPGQDGAPGAKGDTGEQGIQGYPGTPGQDGAPGAKGDTGDTGLQGDPGTPGTKGDQGDPGTPGTKGDKGDTGNTGAPGQNGTNAPPGMWEVDGDGGLMPDVGVYSDLSWEMDGNGDVMPI